MDAELKIDCEIRFNTETRIAPRVKIALEPGRITALYGPSGCGKTTCLRLIAGLQAPSGGTVQANDAVWADAARGFCLPPQRRNIGYLFQSYALFPHLTVRENLAYGLGKLAREARAQRVSEIAGLLEIAPLLDCYPATLSGGQAQRVALGRAVVTNPRCLLLDEPLSALDAALRSRLGEELRSMLKRLGIPVVLVTHERSELGLLADDLIVMNRGEVLAHASVEDLYQNPTTIECAHILGFENIVEVDPVGEGTGVKVRGLCLDGRLVAAEGAPRHIVIAAEEIGIGSGSAKSVNDEAAGTGNTFAATLTGLRREGALLRLEFEQPFPLVVRTTPQWFGGEEPKLGERLSLHLPRESVRLI